MSTGTSHEWFKQVGDIPTVFPEEVVIGSKIFEITAPETGIAPRLPTSGPRLLKIRFGYTIDLLAGFKWKFFSAFAHNLVEVFAFNGIGDSISDASGGTVRFTIWIKNLTNGDFMISEEEVLGYIRIFHE